MFKVSHLSGFGAGVVGAPSLGDKLLLETGDFLLLESGDKLLLETGDPHWVNVELLVKFDGSATDLSDNTYTLTPNGNVQIDTVNKKFGSGSALFDGTGDYYSVPGASSWDFGTGDFTVETHARFTGGGFDGFIGRGASGNSRWLLFLHSNGKISFTHVNTQIVDTFAFGTDYRDSVFYHIAVSRVDGVTRLFFDGIEKDSSSSSFDITTSSSALILGSEPNDLSSGSMTGNQDNIRITKGVGRYSSNFTPPSVGYPEE